MACIHSSPSPVSIVLPRSVEIRADWGTEISFLSTDSKIEATAKPPIEFQKGREWFVFGKHFARFKLAGEEMIKRKVEINIVSGGQSSWINIEMNPPTDGGCASNPSVVELK